MPATVPRAAGAWTPGQLAGAMAVDPKTVRRWCNEGKIQHFKTPGGHVRIPDAVARRLLETGSGEE